MQGGGGEGEAANRRVEVQNLRPMDVFFLNNQGVIDGKTVLLTLWYHSCTPYFTHYQLPRSEVKRSGFMRQSKSSVPRSDL